jgi:hypothetical protein
MYISSVDSGNLAGHLLTLQPGLLALADQPIVNPRWLAGIDDTFRIFRELAEADASLRTDGFEALLDTAMKDGGGTLRSCHAGLKHLTAAADALCANIKREADFQLAWWADALARQCRALFDELLFLAPWSAWLASVDESAVAPELRPLLDAIPTLRALAGIAQSAGAALPGTEASGIAALLAQGSGRAVERLAEIDGLALQARELSRMDVDFLYDNTTHLMAIGYSVSEQRCDNSSYDLLASEVRLGIFVLIAQGLIPQESWFALGRQLTMAGGEPILLSWSGSIFEYLMPLLVMPNFDNTLLDQTYGAVVRRQIDYGAQREVPWGISESGFHTFDAALNYQYRAFGVPGLGLKRGLGDDLVVAPYASMLALLVAPEPACINMQRLADNGFAGNRMH